ncbi:MAG: hypothetical protein JW963_21990 [Anaerolineales bacterium]|nr:hypothetical protein [Anaerolineales bacterium]
MKPVPAFIIALILIFSSVFVVNAQAAESIWLTANTLVYKTGETVTVKVNAVSSTPIQGFTFQIRYDPACLQPINATSPIPGMNGLSLPQNSGLVDASFASTTPQTVNGVLAEVHFLTLAGCQTNLTLESASLAIRNESGFAAPLAGVTVGEKNVGLVIDKSAGVPSTPPVYGTPLALGTSPSETKDSAVIPALLILALAVGGIIVGVFVAIKLLRR